MNAFFFALLITFVCLGEPASVQHFGKGRVKRTSPYLDSCEIDARLDLDPKQAPLILYEEGDEEWALAVPNKRTDSSSYMVLSGKDLLLTCPGRGNNLVLGTKEVAEAKATCSSTGGSLVFIINDISYNATDVHCTRKVEAFERETGNLCAEDGTELKLGFMVNQNLYPLVTTCHRLSDGKTYYSSHTLDGSQFPQKGSGGHVKSTRPQFQVHNSDLFRGFSPNSKYGETNELNALVVAMGSDAYDIFDHKSDQFFSRGHLSPNADFVLDTWRDATFLYVNAQPQWQSINGGSWNTLESTVRKHVQTTGRKFTVITGTDGVLKPKDKAVYLATANRMPVPESYLKLLQDVESKQCISFVSTNFPMSSSPKVKCKDICSGNGWPALKDANKKGYVYCCSYTELKAAFATIPDTDCSGGVLQYQG